jgi:hypothetical protein
MPASDYLNSGLRMALVAAALLILANLATSLAFSETAIRWRVAQAMVQHSSLTSLFDRADPFLSTSGQ